MITILDFEDKELIKIHQLVAIILKKKMLVFFRAFFRVFSENYIMSEKVFLRNEMWHVLYLEMNPDK